MNTMAASLESYNPWSSLRHAQRRSLRRAVRLECEVVRERDFKRIGCQAVDLSEGGMLVLADRTVLTGEDVIISFRTPLSPIWFDACGSVARVVHGRRPGDFGPCVGIQFDDVDDAGDQVFRTVLHEQLRTLPPPLPRRAVRLDLTS